MRKISSMCATFDPLLTITLCAVVLSGCFAGNAVPESRYARAEEFVQQGVEMLRAGRLSEARSSFEVAAELAPVAAATDGLGCIELLEGRPESASRLFREAYQMDALYDQALLNWALALEVQGKVDEAYAMYMKYLDLHPDSVSARNNLAALEYDRGGGTMVVLRALTKAAMLSPTGVLLRNIAVARNSKEK